MRIPNKFNGYSADNIRLYNDPVTLTALTAAGAEGSMAGAALASTAAAAAPVAAAATAAPALGILPEATGILPEALGGAQGVMQAAAPAVDASAKALATQEGLAQGVGDTTAQFTNQINAATPTPPTPGTPSMPNVPTQLTAEQQAAGQHLIDQNTAGKVAERFATSEASGASNGILGKLGEAFDPLTSGFQKAMDYAKENPKTTAAALYGISKLTERKPSGGEKSKGSSFDYNAFHAPTMNPYLYGANGGIMSSYADGGVTGGGPVEQMSRQNAVGANTQYPMADQQTYGYAPQRPISQNMIDPQGEQNLDPYTGMPKFSKGGTTTDDDNGMTRFRRQLAKQEAEREALGESLYSHARAKVEDRGIVSRPLSESSTDPYTASINRMKKANQVAGIKMHEMPKVNMPESFNVAEAAGGGIMRGDLGGYSDGGRLLKGPGDGVSDSIPAVIGNKQPARLADGEFVVPARIVSELGNGSTEA